MLVMFTESKIESTAFQVLYLPHNGELYVLDILFYILFWIVKHMTIMPYRNYRN